MLQVCDAHVPSIGMCSCARDVLILISHSLAVSVQQLVGKLWCGNGVWELISYVNLSPY